MPEDSSLSERASRRRRHLTACSAALVAVASLVVAQPGPRDDLSRTRATIQDLRDIGTAVMTWLVEQEEAREGARDRGSAPEGDDPNVVPVAAFEPISVADLRALLVPTYIPEIPEKDGWGHPYELYLNVDDLDGRRVFLVRSAGRDGRFDADRYDAGAFASADADQDLVWSDGVFIRWPAPGR